MGERVHTWPEFIDRVARAASAMRLMGIQEGDRVGIMALNSDRYLEALFAINWAGAVSVPMNIRWSMEENVYSARDSGISLLIVDDRFIDAARKLSAALEEEIKLLHFCEAEATEGFSSWDEIVETSSPVEPVKTSFDDLAGIYYTGGTTGFPKGVMLSHRALWVNALSVVRELKFDCNTIYLHAAPMFHLADGTVSACATIAGSSHTFIPAFTAKDTLYAISTRRVSASVLVPAMIDMLMAEPEFENSDISSLRSLVYGASPMPEPTLLRAMELLPQVEFTQAYGQTEMGPVVTLLPHVNHTLEGSKSKIRSAGLPITCVQVRIMNEECVEVEQGEPGEIWVRGPSAMDGYWNKPEQTASTMVDGWVKTGDVAYQDEEGFIYICDRAKDMIITGGENVFSAEVENAVLSHDKVSAVAVIGIPDEKFGEKIHAIIVQTEGTRGITFEEIYDHCHALIAGYKCPRSIEIRNEPLPLSGAGKVLKKDLRAPYWTGMSRGVS